MTVYLFIDKVSAEISIVYRDGVSLNAEIYKEHGNGVWTHYAANGLTDEYLRDLRLLEEKDKFFVRRAIMLFVDAKKPGSTVEPSKTPPMEWLVANKAVRDS